jgi:hypothetical protein
MWGAVANLSPQSARGLATYFRRYPLEPPMTETQSSRLWEKRSMSWEFSAIWGILTVPLT